MCVGGQGIYTTTWTETKTYTSTVTSDWPAAAATPVDESVPCVPQSSDWTPCGWVCCDWWQECAVEGQCRPKPGYEGGVGGGGGGGGGGAGTVVTTNGQVTTLFSAPFRVTGTGSAAPSQTFVSGQEPQEDGGSGLSGGAIAGIVIGALAGIGLLFLLCFCCIAKGILGAIFGRKKKKERTREEIVEERYTRSSHAPSSYFTKRGTHSSWYGSSSSPRRSEKKKSSGGKWLGIGAAAATLLALLNIKKDKKPPSRRTPTMYTDSYTYSYTDSSPSKFFSPAGWNHDLENPNSSNIPSRQFKRRRVETPKQPHSPKPPLFPPLTLHRTYSPHGKDE